MQVLEGVWEEIEARAEELRGRRVRVIVLPETSEPIRTGKALLEYLTEIGFVGQWADRTDLPDSPDYVRQLRQQIETRQSDASPGH